MSRLRIALPPLRDLTPDSALEFARLDGRLRVLESGNSTLAQLGLDARHTQLECFLHPADSVLTRLTLPPLTPARVSAAVDCAVQALTLGASQQMHIGHSRRGADGQVQVSWLPKAELQRLGLALAQSRLKPGGLFPAPYRLALPPDGHLSACLDDQHLLLRASLDQGAVEPMVDDHLKQLQVSGPALHWTGESAPQGELEPQAAQRWTGQTPAWGLHGTVSRTEGHRQGWGKALACCALAVGVWVTGLNLYAAREAAQGQQIKAQMSQRVKQAFPHLPVILNPLQQTRQQLAARQNGTPDTPAQGFSHLVQQAGLSLPSMVGSVRQLTFIDGQLHLELSPDIPQVAMDDTLLAALGQAGLSATRNGSVWTLSPAAIPTADDSESRMENDHE
ncbi:hypothetical protein PS3A_11190 [Pseudomonas sp. 3A(2025)]